MIVYWAMFLLPAFMSLLQLISRRFRAGVGYWIFLFLLLLIIGFRETGGDYSAYKVLYLILESAPLSEAISRTEFLYGFLNWFSAQMDLNLYGVNMICGLIYLFGFHVFSSREKRQILMLAVSIPYLVVVVVMGYSRQGVAIGILMLAITKIYDKKPGQFVALCILAMGFHISAFIFMPMAYYAIDLKKYKFGKYIIYFFIALSVVVGIFFVRSTVERLMSSYVVSTHYQSQGALIRSTMSAVAAAMFFWHWRKWGELWNDRRFWMVLSILALLAVPLSFISSTTVDRLGLYLIPLQLVVYARIPILQRSWTMHDFFYVGALGLYAAAFAIWLNLGQFASVLWLPFRSLLFGEIP